MEQMKAMRVNKLLAVVVAAGSVAMSASALQICNVDGVVPYTWEFVDGPGSEPSVAGYVQGKSISGAHFDSFCLELDEYFNPGRRYWVQMPMGMIANNGGVNTDSGDSISVGTAWLYSQFAQGNLFGYTYGNSADAQNLQNAIHMLEGERTVNTGNKFYALAAGQSGFLNNASVGQYGVWVLSLWNNFNGTTYSGRAQDQLYFDGSNRVPDGGLTVAMLGLAMAGLTVLRRRM